jgi:hypothetical protein
MSGYWDAVARAALDLPAAATPRPRSRFEPDAAEPAVEALELEEEGTDATTMAPGHRAEAAAGPASAAPVEVHHQTSDRTAETVRAEPVPIPARPGPLPTPDREAGTKPSTGPAAAVSTPGTPPPTLREVHYVDRVEVHRVERTQTVVEPGARPAPEAREPVEGGPEQPVAASPWEAPQPIEAPVASEAASPIVAVAEPVAPPPASLDRAGVQEPAPLVIEIDRIDIRIEPGTIAPVAAAAMPRRPEASVPSLSDYLARRSEARA